ncbi:MAG: transposase [Armatimonadota bacterium]
MATSVAVFNSAPAHVQERAYITYLLLDGLRRPQRTRPEVTVLCAVGLAGDGSAAPLGMRIAASEDEQSWRALLSDLKAKGVGDGLLLVTCDGHPALMRAITSAYPETPVQISVSHQLMGLARRVDRRWRAACLAEARQIFAAPDRATAVTRFRSWRDQWLRQGERAVSNLETHLASSLTFYRFAPSLWSKIRTVNLVERTFRHARQSAVHMTSDELRPLEDTPVLVRTPQPEIALPAQPESAPPVQPETGGTPAATLEAPVQELSASAAEQMEVAPMPIEQETRPSSNGDAGLHPAQSVDLSADADFMWWLRRQRRASARRVRILIALAMSLAGLTMGIALSLSF